MAARTMLWSFQETWLPVASERLWDHPEMINILVCENQPQISSLLVINEKRFWLCGEYFCPYALFTVWWVVANQIESFFDQLGIEQN